MPITSVATIGRAAEPARPEIKVLLVNGRPAKERLDTATGFLNVALNPYGDKAPPEGPRADAARSYIAPRTPLEEALVAIWGDVLDLERVGTDDNFFEFGGHSLLAVRVISRVRDWLKAEVPLQTLFRAPTPGQFAARVLADVVNPAAQQVPVSVAEGGE